MASVVGVPSSAHTLDLSQSCSLLGSSYGSWQTMLAVITLGGPPK